MEIQQIKNKNATLENQGVVQWLYVNYKMDIYTIECTHYKYACSQSCLILLASCNLIACDGYITIRINVTPNQPLFCN